MQQCIWDANSGLSPERINFTADLMAKVGNIKEGKKPTYEEIVDTTFAKKAIEQVGEWKGPVCPTAAFLVLFEPRDGRRLAWRRRSH